MYISARAGMPTTARLLAMVKRWKYLQRSTSTSGRARRRGETIKTIWCITTGIGSGIGALRKPVTMVHMKLIAADGSWAPNFQPVLLQQADDMPLKMIG